MPALQQFWISQNPQNTGNKTKLLRDNKKLSVGKLTTTVDNKKAVK